MRVGTHTANASRWQVGQFWYDLAVLVEQLFGLVALHPFFQYAHVSRLLVHLAHRYLVRAPIVLSAFTVHLLWVAPLDEVWRVPVSAEKVVQFFMTDPGEHAGIGDFVAVQM